MGGCGKASRGTPGPQETLTGWLTAIGVLLAFAFAFWMCGCATVAVDGQKTFIHTVGDAQVTPVPCPPEAANLTPPPSVCYEVKGGTISDNAAKVIPSVFGAIVTAIGHLFVP